MSVFNAEKYLREAIDSILAQTFGDFEFVIYDDASTDQTRSILESYDDPRIVLRCNKENCGLTANLEEGMRLARGAFVARMDGDDIAKPERLGEQLKYLDEHPDVAILGTQVELFRDDGIIAGVTHEPEEHGDIMVKLFVNFTLFHPTVMFRMSEMRRHSLNYNPDFRYSQDHELWTRAMLDVRLANHPKALMRMRIHGNSISRANHGQQQECSNRVRRQVLERLGLSLSPEEEQAYNLVASACPLANASQYAAFSQAVNRIRLSASIRKTFPFQSLQRELDRHLYVLMYCRMWQRDFPEFWKIYKRREKGEVWYRPPLEERFRFWCRRILRLVTGERRPA